MILLLTLTTPKISVLIATLLDALTLNYIWECKSSYTDPGGAIDTAYLKSAISAVEARWKSGKMPSGYYYIFPVNLISNEGRQHLENFKNSYKNQVEINYYDRDQVQKLILKIEKLDDMESLINYVTQIGRV